MKTSPISQVIILMMENRSFDHLLGYSNLPVDGVLGKDLTCPLDPSDPSSSSSPINPDGLDECPDDPRHGFDDVQTQINQGDMNGFLKTAVDAKGDLSNPISMFTPTSAPIINTLAANYAVFDRWFASVPSSTDPNRGYAMSGTSNGVTNNFNGTLWTQQSHIDFLNARNVSAGGYYQDDLWALGYFTDFHKDMNAVRIKEMDSFYTDLDNNALPEYTWLQPRSTVHATKLPAWQHPDARVTEGERLIKDVYEAIRASDKWSETLFVITYDEHGGFYDHVAPPATVAPDGNAADNFAFDRLGVRVPTIAISPWTKKGVVYNEGEPATNEFDHASLIRTANEIFGVDEFMTARDAWSKSFAGVVTGEMRTDCIEKLPEIPGLLDEEGVKLEIEKQKLKDINEHLEGQLLMFCKMHYEEEFEEGVVCESGKAATVNQHEATQWIMKEQAKMFENRKSAKAKVE